MGEGIRVEFTPKPKFFKALRDLDPSQNLKIFEGAAMEIALRVRTNAIKVQILSGNGPVHPTHLTHRTGDLRDSIQVDRAGLPRSISVGTNLNYGYFHETGDGVKKKRPFLKPALKFVEPKMVDILVKHWKKATR